MRNKTTRRRSARSGFTMIEQIGLVALTATMILMTASWIHESMKMSHRFKQRRDNHIALSTFARQFQNDVWRCRSMVFEEANNLVRLEQHAGGQSTYRLSGNQIHFEALVSGKPNGRQRYELGDDYFMAWDRTNFPKRIALNVFRSADSTAKGPDAEASDAKHELTIGASADRFSQEVAFGPSAGAKR